MNESLVFESCDETHVFPNAGGGVTIKQAAPMGDVIILIPIDYVELVIKALIKAKSEAIGLGG